jgi:KDO2-lipid IV(A) lauroyltransferase
MEAWIRRERAAAGIGTISTEKVRDVYASLRANRCVAMVADQDARRHGVFVPFLGRPASTPVGPARIALATGAPIVTAFVQRQSDGRHVIEMEPPIDMPARDDPDAVERITVAHVARLEQRVRRAPEHWFWVHRRWKTPPPVPA